MTLAADIAGDHSHFDGVELVTVTTQPGSVETTDVSALQMPLNLGPDAVVTENRRTTWNVWSTTLTIRPGDRIREADGTVWVVESSVYTTLKTRWRCICQEAR